MKRAIAAAILIGAGMFVMSCGYSNPTTPTTPTSGITFRAFVSNPLFPVTGGGGAPVLNIVDASKDLLALQRVSLVTNVPQAGMMAVSPNKRLTMVYSGSNNSIALVDNTAETIVSSGNSTLPAVLLPGSTESMFVSKLNTEGFAAVPTAPVLGQSPGAILRISMNNNAVDALVPLPGVRFVIENNSGNSVIALSDTTNVATLVAPSLIGVSDPLTPICCFDHPVWAVFSADDSTAYVLNCGPECGGTAASVSVIDVGTLTITKVIPVTAATMGMISGSTLYVAGTAPGTPCGGGTAATSCGTLTTIDLGSESVTRTATITDGYHTRMELANGQIFVGARLCTNVNTSNEVRGCLSMYNPTNGHVVVGTTIGDVTGIQPITNRNAVYICEGGNLRIYDTTTDALQSDQIDIIGQAIDVKLVD